MQRYGAVIRLKPGVEEKYKDYHAHPWPEINEMIRKCNIRNYTIFLKDGTLFGYYEYHGTDHAGGYGEDGCRPEDAGVVGHHGTDAAAARYTRAGRMVGRHGRSLALGLTLCIRPNRYCCHWR